ncbi:MAG: hypothetical protein K2O78_03970 [Muribaculaceae bacterium]|nr:hypothetical protein [Muribaculaceae bacterium]MDE7080793.1 hypothetical protein [Muribaculaceae bacterium]
MAVYEYRGCKQVRISRIISVCKRHSCGDIMSVRHRSLPISGVQIHPESIITNCGERMLKKFLALSMSFRRE